MQDPLPISPIGAFDATIRPPGSKSLTNRALLIAALAEGESSLVGPLNAEDTRVMIDALGRLGVKLKADQRRGAILLEGVAGRFPKVHPSQDIKLDLANAGTAYRFLTAACCLGKGRYHLDGIERMHERPIGQLVVALDRLGGQIEYLSQPEFPPVRVIGGTLTGGSLNMPPTLSSQYISALLLCGPYMDEGLTLTFDGPVTSAPYVRMTLSIMEQFGADVAADHELTKVTVRPGAYHGREYEIEPDASNASYFLAAAAITPGSRCTAQRQGRDSCQGDVGFADVLARMGAETVIEPRSITVAAPGEDRALRGVDVDLCDMPDMAQTLAVVALFAAGPTTIRGLGTLRIKETDRLAAMETELARLGAEANIDGDSLHITPPDPIAEPARRKLHPATIKTYNDHRMAMSFAVAGLRSEGIRIANPGCVDKTFPDFFEQLMQLGTKITQR